MAKHPRTPGFPRHPRCGTRGIPATDRAVEITSGETITFRGFTCPGCSKREGRPWHFWTAERIYLDDAPTARLRYRMADDFEGRPDEMPPQPCEAPGGGDPAGGAGTVAPRKASTGHGSEMPGIRGAA